MSKPEWVSDLPEFLNAVDDDYARIYSRLGLGYRLVHSQGVTLLLPGAAARKELVKKYEGLRSEADACALKDELLGLIISGSVSPDQWRTLATKGYYVNAAGRKVKVEGEAGKGVKLEGGAKAELSHAAKLFRCTREGPAAARNFVYEVDKLPAKGEDTDERVGRLLAEAPVQGGADSDAESRIFLDLLQRYAAEKSAGRDRGATDLLNQFFVKIGLSLVGETEITASTESMAVLFMLRTSAGGDVEDAKSIAAAYALLAPGATERLSLLDRGLAQKLLNSSAFMGDPNAVLQGLQRKKSLLLFADAGEDQAAADARFNSYVSARAEIAKLVRDARSLTERVEIIAKAYKDLCTGKLNGASVLSDRAVQALAKLTPCPDRLLAYHLARHDMEALASGGDVKRSDWDALARKQLTERNPVIGLQLYPMHNAEAVRGSIWLRPRTADSLGNITEQIDAAVLAFAARDLLDLEAVKPAVAGGAPAAVSGGMLDGIRAWAVFGGGDVGELVAQLRAGGCPCTAAPSADGASDEAPIDSI